MYCIFDSRFMHILHMKCVYHSYSCKYFAYLCRKNLCQYIFYAYTCASEPPLCVRDFWQFFFSVLPLKLNRGSVANISVGWPVFKCIGQFTGPFSFLKFASCYFYQVLAAIPHLVNTDNAVGSGPRYQILLHIFARCTSQKPMTMPEQHQMAVGFLTCTTAIGFFTHTNSKKCDTNLIPVATAYSAEKGPSFFYLLESF